MLKIIGKIFIVTSLLPWVNFGLNSRDTQVWAVISALVFLFSISKKIRVPPNFRILSLCFFTGFVVAMINTQDQSSFLVIRAFVGYFGFLFLLLALFNYLIRFGFPINLFLLINYLYLIMGVVEIFYPEISEIFSARRTAPHRGVTSLAPEPTFFAMYLFFSSWILLEVRDLVIRRHNLYFVVMLNISAIIFLAKSSMMIGFLVLGACFYSIIIILSRVGLKKIIFLVLSAAVVSTVSIEIFSKFLADTRPYFLATSLLNSTSLLGWIESDGSVSARVGSMYFSIVGAFYSGLIPNGFDSFLAMRSELRELWSMQFRDPVASNVIMSWVGAIIFELGIFGLFAVGVFVYGCYPKLNRSVSKAALLILVLFSAIPLGFPMVPMLFITLAWIRIQREKRSESKNSNVYAFAARERI